MIKNLICDRKVRLGQHGIAEFQNHPFFTGIDWDNIHSTVPPYVPEISSRTDTSNFDVDVEESRIEAQPPTMGNSTFSGKNLPFVGFSFNRDSKLSDIGMRNLDNNSAVSSSTPSNNTVSIPTTTPEQNQEVLMLQERLREVETKLTSAESQRNVEKKEKDDARLDIKNIEEKLKAKTTDMAEKDREIKQLLQSIQAIETQFQEQESQRQRDAIRVQHFEEDEKIMKGRIEQLRSDYRQQEKIKKELVDQLKYAEQKNEADQERIRFIYRHKQTLLILI